MALPEGSEEDFKRAHGRTDLDTDNFAQHHSLGTLPGQAAAGNHTHSTGAGFPGYATSAEIVDVDGAPDLAGTSPLVARGDHKHDIANAVAASTQNYGDAASAGVSNSLSAADHKHGFPAAPSVPGFGVSADLANVTKAAENMGALGTVARSDHKHDIDTAVVSTQAFSDAAAEGTATTLARSDHKHGMPANPTPGYATVAEIANVDHAAESAGASALVARGDHKHDVNSGVPINQAFADAATAGTATSLSLSDHKHGMPANPVPAFAAPSPLTGSTEGAGAAATIPRSDHTHRMPKKRYRCTADTANTTVTSAAITGIAAHALTAGKVYEFRAVLWVTVVAATTGCRPSLVASGGLTATDFQATMQNAISTTTVETLLVTALGTQFAATAGIIAGGLIVIEGIIKVNVAGSIQLQFASEVAASVVTVKAGSYMTIEEVAE